MNKEVKIYCNGKEVTEEIFCRGFVYYQKCPFCSWITQKYYENTIQGIVPCDQCGNNVIYNYHHDIHPEEELKL